MMTSHLLAQLYELVPVSGSILARDVARAYSRVPWILDQTKRAQCGMDYLDGLGYSTYEAAIGHSVSGGFRPYSLVYEHLGSLLDGTASDLDGSQDVIGHCGEFIRVVLNEDLGVKEALAMYLTEDLDRELVSRLARSTMLRGSREFHKMTGMTWVRPADAENSFSRGLDAKRFLRYSDFWDAPSCLLEKVPEVSASFSRLLVKAIREAEVRSMGSEVNYDENDAVVGQLLRGAISCRSLVAVVINQIVDEVFQADQADQAFGDTINGCCKFIAVAIGLDDAAGGDLIAVLQRKVSSGFARIALEFYREESEFGDVLRAVASRS